MCGECTRAQMGAVPSTVASTQGEVTTPRLWWLVCSAGAACLGSFPQIYANPLSLRLGKAPLPTLAQYTPWRTRGRFVEARGHYASSLRPATSLVPKLTYPGYAIYCEQ